MKLHFGCGNNYMLGWVNVDINSRIKTDKVFDFDKFPYPFKDNTFNEVYSDNVLEHLKEPVKVIEELHRICKNGAVMMIKVPYYNCSGNYNDPTHQYSYNRRAFINLVGHGDRSDLTDKKFDLNIKLIPTRLGKLIPRFIREYASFIIGEVYNLIEAEIVVRK